MLVVEYSVLSTYFRFVYGDTTSATERCASTWSGPFWVSSSITNTAVSFQNLLFVTASTTIPSARSLSATIAFTVGIPTRVPAVWSLPIRTTCIRGMSPLASNLLSSETNRSARLTSGYSRS